MLRSQAKSLMLLATIVLCGCREPYQSSEKRGGFVVIEHMYYNPLRIEGSNLEYRFTEFCNEQKKECYVSWYDEGLEAGLMDSPKRDLRILFYNNINGALSGIRGTRYKFLTEEGLEIACGNCPVGDEHLRPTQSDWLFWIDSKRMLLQGSYAIGERLFYRAYLVEFKGGQYLVSKYFDVPQSTTAETTAIAHYNRDSERMALLICAEDCKFLLQSSVDGDWEARRTSCLPKDDPSLEISGDDFVVKCSKVGK